MSDYPQQIAIVEEGPREGFQIEPGPIATGDKIKLIDALSRTGVTGIQACSFVSPKLVPGWADAEAVVNGIQYQSTVKYTALWFNKKGIDRALAFKGKLSLIGTIHTVASEAFSRKNLNRTREQNLAAMRIQTQDHVNAGIDVTKISVMAAFGCNFSGDVTLEQVLQAITDGYSIATDSGSKISEIALADTMGWANPTAITRIVGAVRDRWNDVSIRLHLHDTRGLGIANAHAGLLMGVSAFDTTVGGLGGCPFAAHKGAPGNIATEELALLAEELGIATGIDIDALIDAGHLAEHIVGHPLPSAVLRGGSLNSFRPSSK